MSGTVKLPKNHLRSVSVSMYLIEKSVDELQEIIQKGKNGNTYQVVNDLDEKELENDIKIISKVKEKIAEMSGKYSLRKDVTYMSRIRNSKKSKMWEILCDTNSKRLKGFGELPEDMAEEVDADINAIIELVEKL